MKDLPEVDFDFQSVDTLVDPYPLYEKVRAAGRLVRNTRTSALLVTGYDDATAVFRDTGSFSSSAIPDRIAPDFPPMPSLISSDPPMHGRLRMALRPMFAPRAVKAHGTHARNTLRSLVAAGEITERIMDGQVVGIVDDLIAPLTVRVIMHVLGVAPSDSEWFVERAWALIDLSGRRVAETGSRSSPGKAAANAWNELDNYYTARIGRARREEASTDPFLSRQLLRELRDDEIFWSALLILLAGADSTVKFVSSCVALMSRHRDQRARLVTDAATRPSGVEELLRYAGPTQFDPRLTRSPAYVAGHHVEPGETIWVMTAAANRDPGRYDRPGQLDVMRKQGPHLAFGHGIHLCLGAPVARMVALVALDYVLGTLPPLEVASQDYGRGIFVRGPIRLDMVRGD